MIRRKTREFAHTKRRASHRRPCGRPDVAQEYRITRDRCGCCARRRASDSRGGRPLAKDSPSGPPRAWNIRPKCVTVSTHSSLPIHAAAPESAAGGQESAPACPPGPGGRSSRPAQDRREPERQEPPVRRQAPAALPASRRIADQLDWAQHASGAFSATAAAGCRRFAVFAALPGHLLREPLPRLPRLALLRLPPLDPVVDRRKLAFFWGLRPARPDRIEVHGRCTPARPTRPEAAGTCSGLQKTGRCSHPPGSRAGDQLGHRIQPGNARQPAARLGQHVRIGLEPRLTHAPPAPADRRLSASETGSTTPGDFVVRTSRGRCRADFAEPRESGCALKNRVAQDIDGKLAGKELQPAANPGFAMLVVLAGGGVPATASIARHSGWTQW